MGLGQSSQCRKVSKDFINFYWLATKPRDIAKFALLHFCNNNLIIYIVQKYKFENSDMSMLIGCLLFSGLIRAEEEPQAKFFASQAKLFFSCNTRRCQFSREKAVEEVNHVFKLAIFSRSIKIPTKLLI